MLTEILKKRRTTLLHNDQWLPRNQSALPTVTGTSAGAVNSLLAGLEACAAEEVSPEESLFYDIWVKTIALEVDPAPDHQHQRQRQHHGLLSDAEPDPLAIFSGKPISEAIALSKERIETLKFKEGCSFDLGVVVSHLEYTTQAFHTDASGNPLVETPHLTERFTVRVTTHYQNEKGSIEVINLTPPIPTGLTTAPKMPENAFYAKLGHTDHVSPQFLLAAIRASGAFPVAFAPQELTYSRWDPSKQKGAEYTTHTARFTDGGSMNNAPIRLAVTINSWARNGGDMSHYFRPNPWFEELSLDRFNYVFVNPSVTSWIAATPVEKQSDDKPETMIGKYLKLVMNLFSAGSSAELSSSAEQHEFIRQARSMNPRLTVTYRNLPVAGEQLIHFMAFLDEGFRDFDYYVGMADALWQMQAIEPAAAKQILEDYSHNDKRSCLIEVYKQNSIPIGGPPEKTLAYESNWLETLPDECSKVEKNFKSMLAGRRKKAKRRDRHGEGLVI